MKHLFLTLVLSLLSVTLIGCTKTSQLPQRVAQNVENHKFIAPYTLTVNQPEFRKKRVTLDGTVASRQDSEMIEDIARNTEGVDIVENNLVVNPRKFSTRQQAKPVTVPDTQIAKEMSTLLSKTAANTSIKTTNVKNGIVYLDGDAPNFREVDQILARTLNVKGVKKVESRVTVNGKQYMQVWDKTSTPS